MPQCAKLWVWAQVRHRGGPPPYGHKTGRSGGVNPKGSHDSGLKPAMAHLPLSPWAEGYKKAPWAFRPDQFTRLVGRFLCRNAPNSGYGPSGKSIFRHRVRYAFIYCCCAKSW